MAIGEMGVPIYVSRRGIEIRSYDVLQINCGSSTAMEWMDYATIKEPDDAHMAFQIVGAEGGFGHPHASYRIRRGNGQIIVECCGGS